VVLCQSHPAIVPIAAARLWRASHPAGQQADWGAYVERRPDKVKRRVRKGIPDEFRGRVWSYLSGVTHRVHCLRRQGHLPRS